MSNPDDYLLGYSGDERARLELQARAIAGLTEGVLVSAGIEPGMRVLDVGCGVGDVSMIVRSLVGSGGSVLGVDRDEASLDRARVRVEALGYDNVSFARGEMPDADVGCPFDAVVGRLFLVYFPHPAAVVRSLLRLVRPGGVVAFHEPDMSSARSEPEIPSVAENVARLNLVFERCGFRPRVGTELGDAFAEAGLSASMSSSRLVERPGGGDQYVPVWLAATMRSLLPALAMTGVATAEEVDVGSLEARIGREATEAEATLFSPMMVGAWARLPLAPTP